MVTNLTKEFRLDLLELLDGLDSGLADLVLDGQGGHRLPTST